MRAQAACYAADAFNDAWESNWARMCERKFGQTVFAPAPLQTLHFKNANERPVPLHDLQGAANNRVPHSAHESLPLSA
jgi:hypothetical protein